ncbi:SDR family oxidoreductase [Methylocucumis oryzae]|uniref:SDR family oxidoreductase n=1 Tax=Methylocucumis oryzae TaxID=1632867 RepID=UPI001EF9F5E4|nr:NAD(P)H-binding protein [Methylocucumis oryzae]
MKIFLTGATGFIGRSVLRALLTQGHTICACCRHPERLQSSSPQVELIVINYNQMLDEQSWYPYLHSVDTVINCVGVIVETPQQTL